DISISDSELWELFREGNLIAFELIYKDYFDKLYNYGLQFIKDETLVEDVIQDLFIDLKRRCNHLSQTDTILPYLYSAFRRKMIRARDKANKFQELEENSLSFQIDISIEDQLIDEEGKGQQKKSLANAMNQLSEKHREIIFLYYYENMSYEEIKEIQGFDNVKSARNLLYKAVQSLRTVFKFVSFLLLIKLIEIV
ncbi:MAG: sigma-70 family RNA polymerase sigma factor, partial [Bacteroidetes bacterium]|nr:sigma-70 family RNA polymerase sigma factor [Bacteroidota bacterium]